MSGINKLTKRILVIDDNPAIHEDFRKILIKTNQTEMIWKIWKLQFLEPRKRPFLYKNLKWTVHPRARKHWKWLFRLRKRDVPLHWRLLTGVCPGLGWHRNHKLPLGGIP